MSDNKASILPSFDRANSETAAGFFAELKRIWDVADETCIPAIVEEYNAETRIAKVSPLPVRVFDTLNGEVEKMRESVEIPVLSFAHGGFIIDAPLFRGDTGYVIAANKSCETIRENNGEVLLDDIAKEDLEKKHGRADTFATKQYAWGFFLPCSWAKNANAGEKQLVIRSAKDGAGSFTIDKDGDIIISANGSEFKIHKDGFRFNSTITIESEDKKVVIDPKKLDKSSAEFREILVVTGLKHGKDENNIVALTARKMMALVDEGSESGDVEFEVGGGVGSSLQLKVNGVLQTTFDGTKDESFNVAVPTVNNGTLTLQVNGTTQATFSANQSGASTFNVPIPSVPEVGNGRLRIVTRSNGLEDWFYANQSADQTVTIPDGIDLATGSVAPSQLAANQFITQMKYDYSDQRIKVKVRQMVKSRDGFYFIGLTPESDWLMIEGGQAVEE